MITVMAKLIFTFRLFPIGLLLSFELLTLVSSNESQEMHNDCPKLCTCHSGYFSQLSFTHMIYQKTRNVNSFANAKPTHKLNDVLFEEDKQMNELPSEIPLKISVCMTEEQHKLKELLAGLQNTQVLTLLQNSNTENVSITSDYFEELKDLEILEMIGVEQRNTKMTHKIEIGHLFLKPNALHVMNSLEYLNLQNVQLLGNPNQGNKILPTSAYEYTIKKYETNQILQVSQQKVNQKLRIKSHKNKKLYKDLVFLSPNDIDILPYETYKEEHEMLGVYSFSGLKNLKFLRLYQCGLKEINWEMFNDLHNLETLSLEGNKLLFIPEFSFYGAPRLKSLSLAKNKLLDIQCWSLAGLLQLRHLDLSNNNITHLSELSLPPFPELMSADFTNNPLEVIFPSTFEVMNATQDIHIGSVNTMLTVQPNSFSGLDSLLTLKLTNVNQDVLERDLVQGMPKLEKIEISGRVQSVSFDTFLDMPNLQDIVMKNCSLEHLSMDTFYGLYNLKLLDLSNNLLTSLPPGLFDQQFSLKELYLQNNKLTTLPVGFLANVPAKLIRLDGNPWQCSCAMKDWKPSIINVVKQKSTDKSLCRSKYDKGSCLHENEEYVYSKEVEPRCETPAKYKGWSIFHLLHKEFRCVAKIKSAKFNRKAYLAQKIMEYEKTKESKNKHYLMKKYYKEKNKTLPKPAESLQANQFHNYTASELTLQKDQSLKNDKNTSTENNTTNKLDLNNTEMNQRDEDNIEEMANDIINQNVFNVKEPINSTYRKKDNINTLHSVQNMYNSDENNNLKYQFNKQEKLSKKEREKLQMLKDKQEKRVLKEKVKMLENLPNLQKKNLKTELENRHKEKLKVIN